MDWIPGIVNTICVWFDYLIYSISTACYVLFGAMTEMNVDSIGESFANLVSRLQTFLGLIMMFVIAFNLLKILVDPSKAGQSSGTLVKRIAITVVLLVSMNFIFNNIFGELQTALIESNTIEKIILGNDTSQTQGDAAYTGYKKYVGTGKFFAYHLFFSFVDVDNNANAKQIKADIMAGNNASLYDVVGVINDDGVYYRFPIISGAVGILLAVIFVSFAIDVGVRAFTLMLLEVIAPIPIIAYIADENMLKAFMKSYISTFIELFARIFIIYITLFLMQFCMKSILGTVAGGETTSTLFPNMGSDVGTFFRSLLLVAVIFSLFMFAKKVPSLAKSIFGLDFGSTSLNPFKITGNILRTGAHLGMAAGGAALGAGIGAAATIGTGAGLAGAARAALQGARTGGQGAYRVNNIRDALGNAWTNTRDNVRTQRQGGYNYAEHRAAGGKEGAAARHNLETIAKGEELRTNMMNAADAANLKKRYNVSSRDEYIEKQDEYIEAQAAIEAARASGDAKTIAGALKNARDVRKTITDRLNDEQRAELDDQISERSGIAYNNYIEYKNHAVANNDLYQNITPTFNTSTKQYVDALHTNLDSGANIRTNEQRDINTATSTDGALRAGEALAEHAQRESERYRPNGGGNRH